MNTLRRSFRRVSLLVCLIPLATACVEPDDGSPDDPEFNEGEPRGNRDGDDDGGDRDDDDEGEDRDDDGEGDDDDDAGGAEEGGDEGDERSPGSTCTFEMYNYIAFGTYRPDIYLAFVSPQSSSTWGANLLDGIVRYSGGLRVNEVPVGSYDVQVVDEDGDTYSLFGVQCSSGVVHRWDVRSTDID